MNVKKKINKKERRNIKNKKRELRRRKQVQHNQENSKVSSNNIPEYSPIKFDRFGRVCSLVNRKGDVLPTDTEMFGCEIVRDLPDYLKDFIKLMGLGEVIRVPVSNHDHLTGSGKKGRCDNNSHMLSLSIGGHRLYGLSLHQSEITLSSGKKEYFNHITHHSVWITPEGNTRCVTDYEVGVDKKYKLFIPVGLNTIEETFLLRLDNFLIRSSKNYIDYLVGGTGVDFNKVKERVKKKELVRYIRKSGKSPFLHKVNIIDKIDTWWKEYIENSNFGKVSSTTGRSWDYFKNKILNTYYPTSQTP